MRPSPRSFSWFALSLLVGSSAALSGCVVRAQPQPVYQSDPYAGDYATAYPQTPQPAPVVEYRPEQPAYDYFWVDGYWDWTGADWSWSSGYWAPPRGGYIFIGPRYVYEGGRPVYYRGYWQGSNGYRDYNYRVQPQPAWRATPANQPSGAWRGSPPPGNGPSGAWRGSPPNQGYSSSPPPSGAWRGAPQNQPAPSSGSGAWRATPQQPAPAPGWSSAPANNAPPPRGWNPGTAPVPGAGAPASSGGWRGGGAPAAPPSSSPAPGGGWTAAPPSGRPAGGSPPPPMPTMPNAHPAGAPMPTMPNAHPAGAPAPMPTMPNAHPAGAPMGWGGQPVNRQPAQPSTGGWHTAPAASPSPAFNGAAHPNTAAPGGSRPAPAPVQSAPRRGWQPKK